MLIPSFHPPEPSTLRRLPPPPPPLPPSTPPPPQKPSPANRRVPRRSLGASGSGYKPNSRAPTYGDMISYALSQLPSNEGTLDEICDLVGTQCAHAHLRT